MQYRRMGNPTTFLILTVVLPLLGACDGSDGPRGAHGALDMGAQTVLLDFLEPPEDFDAFADALEVLLTECSRRQFESVFVGSDHRLRHAKC